jgi:hypothetical protein
MRKAMLLQSKWGKAHAMEAASTIRNGKNPSGKDLRK